MNVRLVAGVVVLTVTGAAPAAAQLRAELVATGLTSPVAFAQDPANPGVQLVAEQAGRLRVLVNGVLQSADFLDLRGVIGSGGERGLLGVAFDPEYATTGRVFVSFTNLAGHSVVARFTRSAGSPLVGDPTSRFDFRWPDGATWIDQPFGNHNGGNLAFGPDGYLYLGLGDGGSGNDPYHLAQDPMSLLGKMLRLDVSVADSDPEGYDVPGSNPFVGNGGVLSEIWAFGLRNPWRFSFDDPAHGGTGAMVIGDVGQGAWEEIDYEPALAGGRNYGWRNREGAHAHVGSVPPFSTPLIDPIFEYDHGEGRSIIGGYVYRGSALGSTYVGRYFFGDIVFGLIWSVGLAIGPGGEASVTDLDEHTAELGEASVSPSSFGVDAAGEIYVLAYNSGRVYRMASTTTAPPTSSTVCGSTDPFATLGGGTCVGGNWLPPGYPGTSSSPPPAADTTVSDPSVGTGCSLPDPFVSLGGGTCLNGDWLPPGYPIPSAAVPPPSGGSTTTTAPAPTGCVTPDPFVSLGGGTCVAGDWLPPGFSPPPGDSSGPAPSSDGGSTAPPPAPGGCVTPDPFVVLGGGTCVGGNWLPPGYPTP